MSWERERQGACSGWGQSKATMGDNDSQDPELSYH